jgi:hypothetical protein
MSYRPHNSKAQSAVGGGYVENLDHKIIFLKIPYKIVRFRNILGTGAKKVSTTRNNRLTREDSQAVNTNAKIEQVQLLHPR